jgi:hypothetical protein
LRLAAARRIGKACNLRLCAPDLPHNHGLLQFHSEPELDHPQRNEGEERAKGPELHAAQVGLDRELPTACYRHGEQDRVVVGSSRANRCSATNRAGDEESPGKVYFKCPQGTAGAPGAGVLKIG